MLRLSGPICPGYFEVVIMTMDNFKTQEEIWRWLVDGHKVISNESGWMYFFKDGALFCEKGYLADYYISFTDPINWKKVVEKKWKPILYEFKTVLGISHVSVEVWNTEGDGIFFKPGEEQRLEEAQAKKYLALVRDGKIIPTDLEKKHLRRVLGYVIEGVI